MPRIDATIIIVSVVLAFIAGVWVTNKLVDGKFDKVKKERDELRDTATANQRALDEYRQRVEKLVAIADAASEQAARNRDAAGRAAAVSVRLRATTTEVAATIAKATAPEGSDAAEQAVVVLSDLLGRADQTAGELAAAVDAAFTAGKACERAYQITNEPDQDDHGNQPR